MRALPEMTAKEIRHCLRRLTVSVDGKDDGLGGEGVVSKYGSESNVCGKYEYLFKVGILFISSPLSSLRHKLSSPLLNRPLNSLHTPEILCMKRITRYDIGVEDFV
jgi:hypothetical protein